MFSPMPEVAYLRILSKARVASMELAIADGAHDEAVEAFDQALVVARACSHQTTLIEQLVGWSVAEDWAGVNDSSERRPTIKMSVVEKACAMEIQRER